MVAHIPRRTPDNSWTMLCDSSPVPSKWYEVLQSNFCALAVPPPGYCKKWARSWPEPGQLALKRHHPVSSVLLQWPFLILSNFLDNTSLQSLQEFPMFSAALSASNSGPFLDIFFPALTDLNHSQSIHFLLHLSSAAITSWVSRCSCPHSYPH